LAEYNSLPSADRSFFSKITGFDNQIILIAINQRLKIECPADIALAITSNRAQFTQFTGEELQVKFLVDSAENSLKY